MNPTNRPTTPHPTMGRGVGPTGHRGARPKPAGWIYQVHTHDDPNIYVGQSSRPPHVRVNEERRTMPWGPDILPGRDGYTIIRRVESSGDPTIDAVLLDLAEAQEIQRLNPTDNRTRPNPAIFEARLAAARGAIAGDPWGPASPPSWGRPHGPRRAGPAASWGAVAGRGVRCPVGGVGDRGVAHQSGVAGPGRTVGRGPRGRRLGPRNPRPTDRGGVLPATPEVPTTPETPPPLNRTSGPIGGLRSRFAPHKHRMAQYSYTRHH